MTAGRSDEERLLEVNTLQVLRKLLPMLRPFAGRFALGITFILFSTGIEIACPLVIGSTVDTAIAPERSLSALYALCGLYFGLILFKAVFEGLQAYVIQSTGQAVTHDLRSRVFSKVQTLPIAYFDSHPTGRLVTRVINDIKALSELFTASISVLALDFMIILGTVVAMFWMHPRLALVTLITFPGVVLTIHFFGGKLAVAYRNVRTRLSEINAFLGENIGAIATIQRLGAEDERLEKFSGIVDRHQSAQMETLKVFATVQPLTNVLNGISTGTLLALGGYWAVQGKITMGVLVAFLGYLRNLFQPVRDLVEKYNTFLSATVAAERVVGLLNEESEADPIVKPALITAPASYEIRFEDVSFQYPLRHRPAIQNVSFVLPAGKSLAVVGSTGSGKSTLVRLLLKFYEPQTGAIHFAGRPLPEWDRKELRQLIGVIHQDIYLFQGTIRENLALGREHFTDRHLIQQCERAQLWPFLKDRGGLDMPVYEGGSNLSIGERQLISFARILVFDTPVLILDEATSSVDRLVEKRLMAAIQETIAGRTSIVIAHRLSTIRQCDSILVIEKGHVVEQGTHEGLLRHNGLFAKFHEIHSGV